MAIRHCQPKVSQKYIGGRPAATCPAALWSACHQRRELFFAFFLDRLVGMTFLATFLALLATDFAAFFALRVTRLYIDFLAIVFPFTFLIS
jgi:hypothetical protein